MKKSLKKYQKEDKVKPKLKSSVVKVPSNFERLSSDNLLSYSNVKNPQTYKDEFFEVLDPTGISNYPDLIQAFEEKRYSDLPLEVLGSLPLVGKFGKGVKMLKSSRGVPYGYFLPQVDNINEILQEYPDGGTYKEMFPNIPGVYISDKRKIRATTGKPIKPTRDLVSGYYREDVIDSLARTAIENGINPYRAIAQGLAESNLGYTDDNIGHSLYGKGNSPYLNMMEAIKEGDKLAAKLGKTKEEDVIQGYNRYGKLTPNTEKSYHGYKSKSFYGVPIPKEGLDMNVNPLYGKHVLDLQKNVIEKSPEVTQIVQKYQRPNVKGSEIEELVNARWKTIPSKFPKGGTFLTAGGEYHRIYKNAEGDIIVNHPKEDKGKWDTINLTDKADAKTIAEGVAATKKWHKENPTYLQGGTINMKRSLKKYKKGSQLPQHGTGATVGGAVGAGAGMALNLLVPGLGTVAAPLTGALGTMIGETFDSKPDYEVMQRNQEAAERIKYGPKQENPYVDNTQRNFNFPYGGIIDQHMMNPNAELELEETFQTPDGTVGRVDGPSHDNGGIEVNLPEGTRIFSDRLKHNGKTFAQLTKPITTKIATLEKKLKDNPQDLATANSVYLLNQQLDHYFDVQETNKSNEEMKRTLKMAKGGLIKRADGSYSKRGLWDNIRANKGSGKKPTKEMLEQEKKIKAQEKQMGGYIYAEGGINNPGFRALPEEVQQKIIANMAMGGYMYPIGGSLMNDPMFAEGGKLPKEVLMPRLQAHMSPAEVDEYLEEYGSGGYTVRKTNERKGKTHVVIGPDGTKKYFGDPKMGEKGKSKYGKEAFYARHAKNLKNNPYFRAYARATWEEGGVLTDLNTTYIPTEGEDYMEYAKGGIHIKPENKGKFTAWAKSHGMGVQEAASHVMANKEDYSPTIVKRANFAKNAAGWKHYHGGLIHYVNGGPALGKINPRTGQPYSRDEVSSYYNYSNMLPDPFGMQYGGLDNQGKQLFGNYEDVSQKNPLSSFPLKEVNIDDVDLSGLGETTMPSTRNFSNVDDATLFGEKTFGTKPTLSGINTKDNPPGGPKTTEGFFSKNIGTIGQISAGLGSAALRAYNLSKVKAPGKMRSLDFSRSMYNPNLVDYSANINEANRTALSAMDQAQRGFGSSAAAQAFKNKARLNQLEQTGKIYQAQENANTQLLNEARTRNADLRMREMVANQDIDRQNLENQYNYDAWKAQQQNAIVQDLMGTAGDVFGGVQQFKNQTEMANILAKAREGSVNIDTLPEYLQQSYFNTLSASDKAAFNQRRVNRGLSPFAYGGMIKEFKNGGMYRSLRKMPTGGTIGNQYRQSLQQVINQPTIDKASLMDAEYAAALEAGKNKYTSSVTKLDYKVLPKNEKRLYAANMWKEIHGTAPTKKQEEATIKAIEGKTTKSTKANEVKNALTSADYTSAINKVWTPANLTPKEQAYYQMQENLRRNQEITPLLDNQGNIRSEAIESQGSIIEDFITPEGIAKIAGYGLAGAGMGWMKKNLGKAGIDVAEEIAKGKLRKPTIYQELGEEGYKEAIEKADKNYYLRQGKANQARKQNWEKNVKSEFLEESTSPEFQKKLTKRLSKQEDEMLQYEMQNYKLNKMEIPGFKDLKLKEMEKDLIKAKNAGNAQEWLKIKKEIEKYIKTIRKK